MSRTTVSRLSRTVRAAITTVLAIAVLAMGTAAGAAPATAAEGGKRTGKSGTDLTTGAGNEAPAGQALQRRPTPDKPVHTKLGHGQSRTELHLKLAEGLHGRVRNGGLASIKSGENLGPVASVLQRHKARITPLFSAPERVLSDEKAELERRAGKELADLNLYFRVSLPKAAATEAVIDELNASGLVEIAYAEPLPVNPPAIASSPLIAQTATPSFVARQGYRGAAPDGIDAVYAATVPGGRGANVKVVDIEYSWNQNHEDLAAIRGKLIPNGTPADPWNDDSHGTAVMGELVGTDNTIGVTGLVPDATPGMVNAYNTGGYNLANAIWVAQNNTAAGDVILLEQQIPGPNHDGSSDVGLVPVEWAQAYYDAIARATAAGRIVVEAAGNGYQNLDSATYGRAFDRTYRDSGAILVGAGAGGTCGQYNEPARGRLSYSNYGSRLDVQGWGGCVTTAGYGALQGGDRNTWYTATFNGTSSASPIVSGAAVSLSSIAQQRGLAAPTSLQMRTLLRYGATPQTTVNAQPGNIGPLPNLRNAIGAIGAGSTCADDAMEPNDGMSRATPLGFGTTVNGTICSGNLDLFAISPQAGDEVTIDLAFTHAAGDLDVSLHSADGTRISVAETSTDNEQLTATAAVSGTHYVMVYGYQQAANTYRLGVTRNGGADGCDDDALEPNDSMAAATAVEFGAAVHGTVCANNVDLFAVDLSSGETLTAELIFAHANGDLDVSLHDSSGTQIASANSTTDNERLDFTSAAGGRHFIRVYGYQGAANAYRLTVGRVPAMLEAVTGLKVKAGVGRASLSWTLPAGAAGVEVRMAEGTSAPGVHGGTSVYRGAGSAVVQTGLAAGTSYAFSVFTIDAEGNAGPGRSVVVKGSTLQAAAPTSLTSGSVARVRGTLADSSTGQALGNRKVTLFQRKAGTARWYSVATKSTSTKGTVTFRTTPVTKMNYRLRFAGKTAQLGVMSTVVTVRVR